MMLLIPLMKLDQLIPYLWILEIHMTSYIEISKNFMNFIHLLLSWHSSISTIEITNYHFFIISTISLQKFLVSLHD